MATSKKKVSAKKTSRKAPAKKTSESIPVLVICQEWWETERGWGHRPDGYTLHLTQEDYKAWMAEHYAQRTSKEPPNEYSYPSGSPRTLQVDSKVHKQLLASRANDGYGIHVHTVDKSKLL